MTKRLKIGVIGLGGMGRGTTEALHASHDWDLVAVADFKEELRNQAQEKYPYLQTVKDGLELIRDPNLDAVAICTLADVRPMLLSAALKAGKHVWAEKPLAATIQEEEDILTEIKDSGRHVAVNIFNRNAWYHDRIHEFVEHGEIGDLVSVRVRHQTPGLLPETGHGPEGAPFHDCGMHYVDVARWYAKSEYKDWHAQGICLWGHDEPWQVDVHGAFENGVIFNVTQGFIFGQEAKTRTQSCGLELIGTKGVVLMEHDFGTVKIDLHGKQETMHIEGPYGDKKLDVMATRLAEAINGGEVKYPTAKDSVIASRLSWDMLKTATRSASRHGAREDLLRVKEHKAKLNRNIYG